MSSLPVSEVVVESGVVRGPSLVENLAEAPVANMPVRYEAEDKEDGADYYNRITTIRLEWDADVEFWFNSIEASMRQAQVFRQWTKREVLMHLLPKHVLDEVKYLYRQSQDEAGETPYLDIKRAIQKIFKQKPQDNLDRALSRVLSDRPSTLGKQLIEDICRCKPVLNSPCCANTIFGLFRRQMPTAVRNQLADKEFNKNTYNEIFSLADAVFQSNKPESGPQVSAVAQPTQAGAQSADPQVSAVARGGWRGRGRGNRGGRGANRGNGNGNRGGNSNSNSNSNNSNSNNTNSGGSGPDPTRGTNKGAKHSDIPAGLNGLCQTHWTFGKAAIYCRKPRSCPWKDFSQE